MFQSAYHWINEPKKSLSYQQTGRILYVAPNVLLLLCQRMIHPIHLYCSICFFNILSVKNRARFKHIILSAARISSLPTANVTELNNRAITCRRGITHPQNIHFTNLPLGTMVQCTRGKKSCLGKILISADIDTLNKRPVWTGQCGL